jgi:GTP cyclohydrolase IA
MSVAAEALYVFHIFRGQSGSAQREAGRRSSFSCLPSVPCRRSDETIGNTTIRRILTAQDFPISWGMDPRIEKTAEPNVQLIAEHYAAILKEVAADLSQEGLRETPMRAAKALVEMTQGSRMGTEKLTTMFQAECTQAVCRDMVIVEDIHEVGLCEHHFLPITMAITIAYVPDKMILGLSKLSRIAGYFARRWQNQERTAHLIAEFIERIVQPLGVAVLIDGKHMCAMARGARDTHSIMRVNVMHGVFQKDQGYRSELFQRLRR